MKPDPNNDMIPRMRSIVQRQKPCKDCGEMMDYVSIHKTFCFECKLRRKEELRSKRKNEKRK
jgi:hypothetical protein